MSKQRIAGDATGPGDVRPGELYAVHTDDKPGDNAGAPMNETAVCDRCIDWWGGEAIYLAEGAEDRPERLVLTPVSPDSVHDAECNYHWPGEYDNE